MSRGFLYVRKKGSLTCYFTDLGLILTVHPSSYRVKITEKKSGARSLMISTEKAMLTLARGRPVLSKNGRLRKRYRVLCLAGRPMFGGSPRRALYVGRKKLDRPSMLAQRTLAGRLCFR